MDLKVDLWTFLAAELALLAAFGGVLLKVGHVLIRGFLQQFEARLQERFMSQDKAASEMKQRVDRSFAELENDMRGLERGQAAIKEEMLRSYVRREDAIRDQTVTQAKLDALGARIELLTQHVAGVELIRNKRSPDDRS